MKSPRDYAQSLLEKASHDLIAARATITTGKALDTVCFHAQRALALAEQVHEQVSEIIETS